MVERLHVGVGAHGDVVDEDVVEAGDEAVAGEGLAVGVDVEVNGDAEAFPLTGEIGGGGAEAALVEGDHGDSEGVFAG